MQKLQIIPNYHFRKDCPNRLWWGQKRRIWGWASWRVPTGWGRMQDTNNHPTTILSGDQWCCDHYSEGRRRWKSRWDWNYNCRFKDEHSYGIKYMFGRRGVHYSRMQREDNWLCNILCSWWVKLIISSVIEILSVLVCKKICFSTSMSAINTFVSLCTSISYCHFSEIIKLLIFLYFNLITWPIPYSKAVLQSLVIPYIVLL